MISNLLTPEMAARPREPRPVTTSLLSGDIWISLCRLGNIRSAALAVAVSLAPAPTLAAFSAPITLSDTDYSTEPQVTVNGNGHGLVVWEGGEPYRIQSRSITAAGVLGPIRNVSPPDPTPEFARAPQVAIDADGDALIVWSGFGELQARARSKTGTLGPIETHSSGGRVHAPQVAIDAEGDALVVWQRVGAEGAPPRIHARARSRAGTLGSILTLSAVGGHYSLPQVAIDTDGDALVVWARDGEVQSRAVTKTGTLGPIQILGGPAAAPKVAMDADGDSLVVWREANVIARARSKTGTLGPLLTVSNRGDIYTFQVAIDAEGDALVVWDGTVSVDGGFVEARAVSRTGTLGPVKILTGESRVSPEVAIDADGDALVVWVHKSFPDVSIAARTLSRTGALGPTQTLSTRGQVLQARVAIDADGDALVVWRFGPRYGRKRIEAVRGP